MQYISPQSDPGLFEVHVLSNGVTLYHRPYQQTFGQPNIACSAVVMAGGRDDMPGKEGSAHFFEHMPFRGTKTFPTLFDLTNVIERNGGYINAFTTDEATGYEIVVPHELIEEGIKRVSDMLIHPLLHPEDIETERAIIREELRNKQANVQFFARQELYKRLLGSHPLVHAVIGTEEALLSIQKSDLERFHTQFYNANTISLFVVGTYTTETVTDLCERYFGGIQAGKPTVRNQFIELTHNPSENMVTLRPERYNRSVYLLGRIMPPANLKESLMNKLFRDMLASGMNSPLHEEIREKRGLAYNIGLHQNRYQDVSLLIFSVSTQYKNMDEVHKLFWHEATAILTNQPRFDEVKHMLKQTLLHREFGTGSLVDTAIDTYLDYGRIIPLDEFITVLESISLEETAAYLHDYLRAEQFLNVRIDCDAKDATREA